MTPIPARAAAAVPPRPAAGAPGPFRVPPFRLVELPAGARLVLCEERFTPLLHLRLAAPAGAAAEPPGLEGLASLALPLLREGGGRYRGAALARELERRGADLAMGAGWDFAHLELESLALEPAREVDFGAGLLAELIRRPVVPAAALERRRDELLAALAARAGDPAARAQETLCRVLYGAAHRYARALGGSAASLGRIGRDQLPLFHRRCWTPSSLVVTAVGRLDGERLARRLRELLPPRRAAPPPAPLPPPPVPAAGRPWIADVPGAGGAELRLGCAAVDRRHEDFLGLQVLAAVLGGGFGSRLDRALRQDLGLAYGTSCRLEARGGPAPLILAASVAVRDAGTAWRRILAEVERLRRELVPAGELAAARALLRGLAQTALRSGRAVAAFLEHLALNDLLAGYGERYGGQMLAVSPERLRRLAQRYLDPERLVGVAAGPGAALRRQLTAPGVAPEVVEA